MKKILNIIWLITLSYSQYDYNLTDINSTSDTYETNINPNSYTGQVTLHYFGHQN